MQRALCRVSIALAFGVLTAAGSAVALALFMPLEMYPRQDSYIFLAGGRAWNAVQRARFGVWNLWWSEINAAYMLPPPPPGAAGPPDPSIPTTPEGWARYAREDRKTGGPPTPPAPHDDPPSWGTFVFGGSAPNGVGVGTDHGFGWPRPALWYRVRGASSGRVASATGLEGGLLLSAAAMLEVRGYGFRALPLRLCWPGLLIDSALFTVLWSLALYAPSAIRRRRRLRRGLCPRCAYDLNHNLSSGCPECGWGRVANHAASPQH